MFCPVFAEAGPDFVMVRSACVPTFVVAFALLFVLFGSDSLPDTVAMFVTLPLKFGDVLYVAVTVTVWPAVRVPRLQGKTVQPPPLAETNVRFAGVGSLSVTPVAVDGPLFFTPIVKAMF